MKPYFSGPTIQTEKAGYAQDPSPGFGAGGRRGDIFVTPTGERTVLVENDWIVIPEGLELMNPGDYTESVLLDLQDSAAGTLTSFNLRNRACLEEECKSMPRATMENPIYYVCYCFSFFFLDGEYFSMPNRGAGYPFQQRAGQSSSASQTNAMEEGGQALTHRFKQMDIHTNPTSIGAATLPSPVIPLCQKSI